MLKRLTLPVCALLLSTTAAFAADPMPEPVATWSGFYAGVHVGYGWGDADYEEEVDDGTGPLDFDLDDTLAGLTAGYNFSTESLVFGIEGDIAALGLEDSQQSGGPGVEREIEVDSLVTLRARLGFLVDAETLLYVTGGYAGGEAQFSRIGPPGPTFSEDEWLDGWTAGGGAEHKFADNFSAKLEYLYVDISGEIWSEDDEPESAEVEDMHLIRAGVNFHFSP